MHAGALMQTVRVELDPETLRLLREQAQAERRAAAEQAAVILTKALRRRRRPTTEPAQ